MAVPIRTARGTPRCSLSLRTNFSACPFESIRYVQGDTAQVPIGRGTYGARSTVVGGNALKAAADNMIEKGKSLAADMMEADMGDVEFADGSIASPAPIKPYRSPRSPKPLMRRWDR